MKWYQKVLKFLKWLVSIIEAPESPNKPREISSKRVYGLACLVIATILAFAFQDKAAIVVGVFQGSAAAVFVAQAASGT
jgi:hypothetical protein